tara:strand:+ start:494 stop:1180 length:687 start_codon:yes stop_codon:yes gene_type:complete
MGKMKEQFMQMRLEEQDQTINTMHEIAEEARDMMEKHHPIGQERYVDESEFQRNEIIDAMHDIAKQPSTNQLNNNEMTKKTMQEKLQKQPEPIQETRKEVLTRLYKENGLVREDVYKDKRGFSTITRSGVDKIAAKNGITIGYEVILLDVEKGECVLKAAATMKVGNEVRNVMDFGEASVSNNLTGGGKKWLVSMAKKRAMGRVVLTLAGFYEQGMYSKDEMAFEMNE